MQVFAFGSHTRPDGKNVKPSKPALDMELCINETTRLLKQNGNSTSHIFVEVLTCHQVCANPIEVLNLHQVYTNLMEVLPVTESRYSSCGNTWPEDMAIILRMTTPLLTDGAAIDWLNTLFTDIQPDWPYSL